MNRRGFLALLGGAGAALLVPELLVPKRTIFLPPAGGWPVDALASGKIRRFLGIDFIINPPVIGPIEFQDSFVAAAGRTFYVAKTLPRLHELLATEPLDPGFKRYFLVKDPAALLSMYGRGPLLVDDPSSA